MPPVLCTYVIKSGGCDRLADGNFGGGEIFRLGRQQRTRITMDHQQSEAAMGCNDDAPNLLDTASATENADLNVNSPYKLNCSTSADLKRRKQLAMLSLMVA